MVGLDTGPSHSAWHFSMLFIQTEWTLTCAEPWWQHCTWCT